VRAITHSLLSVGTLLAGTVPIVFIEADGTEREVNAEIGKNLLDVAHDNNVELEGMVCCRCRIEGVHIVPHKLLYAMLFRSLWRRACLLNMSLDF
jgi:hypothetical protein